ncbi:MAG: hypothetical protein EBZ60_03585 [Betaproteobacteria bacterium]|nr:hypothetical protein [Betaproteobacteria bacterium]
MALATVCSTRCTSAMFWGSRANTFRPRFSMRLMWREDLANKTKSGLRRIKASNEVSSNPPSLGNAFTWAGQLACLSVPTNRLHSPNMQTVSANEGSKVTMRCGAMLMLTCTPRSSTTVTALTGAENKTNSQTMHLSMRHPVGNNLMQFSHAIGHGRWAWLKNVGGFDLE